MTEFTSHNKGSKTQAMLACSSLPSNEKMNSRDFELLIDAMGDLEKNQKNHGHFHEFTKSINRLNHLLQKENISHDFSLKDLFIWAALEIVDTDVGMDEIGKWMCHQPTLEEIFFSEDSDSIFVMIKNGQKARTRYQKLLKEKLYG